MPRRASTSEDGELRGAQILCQTADSTAAEPPGRAFRARTRGRRFGFSLGPTPAEKKQSENTIERTRSHDVTVWLISSVRVFGLNQWILHLTSLVETIKLTPRSG